VKPRVLFMPLAVLFLLVAGSELILFWRQPWPVTRIIFVCGLLGSSFWLFRFGLTGKWGWS
jgi:hypothetical protein